MSYQYVEIEEVYQIYKSVVNNPSWDSPDFGLLISALERPKTTFLGKDLYPTVFLKAAALLQSIIMNHSFIDGNKRVAWITTKRFLYLNNYHLKADVFDAVGFVMNIANNKLKFKDISVWLKTHSSLI